MIEPPAASEEGDGGGVAMSLIQVSIFIIDMDGRRAKQIEGLSLISEFTSTT